MNVIETKSAALVLSGGGALGAAHVGVVKVLQERGFTFDYFAGVSAGAIVAAMLACEMTAVDVLKRLEEVRFFHLAFDFARGRSGLLRGNKVQTLLDELLEGRRFSDLKTPLVIGTTDFETGERVNLTSGRLSDAIRASISVPVLFVPYFHEGEKRWLVDGGLTQNCPLDLTISQYGGKHIFAVDVASTLFPIKMTSPNFFSRAKHYRKTLERSFRILFKSQQAHFPQDRRVVRIFPDVSAFHSFDIGKLKAIVKAGEHATTSIFEGDGGISLRF